MEDLPPLGGRKMIPPLSSASPPSPALAAGPLSADERGFIDEKRLDALESKLANLAGLPVRPQVAHGTSQSVPLSSGRTVPSVIPSTLPAAGSAADTGVHAGAARGLAGGGAAGAGSAGSAGSAGGAGNAPSYLGRAVDDFDEAEEVEDDVFEESFEDDDEVDAGELPLSGAPPLTGSASPASLMPPSRSRNRLSPLESSMISVDESVSPGRLTSEMQGFDLLESIERP